MFADPAAGVAVFGVIFAGCDAARALQLSPWLDASMERLS